MSDDSALIRFTAGPLEFTGRLERHVAPESCAFFERQLPLRGRLIHARWSGEAVWIPLTEGALNLPVENPTSYPAPGQCLLYAGEISDPEVLLPYGACHFRGKTGSLHANHFLTIVARLDAVQDLGRVVLWEAAQDIVVDRLPAVTQ